MASDFEVGLDSGKMTGACVRAAISAMASSVKEPWVPLVPIRIVGATRRTTAARSYRPAGPSGTKP